MGGGQSSPEESTEAALAALWEHTGRSAEGMLRAVFAFLIKGNAPVLHHHLELLLVAIRLRLQEAPTAPWWTGLRPDGGPA